MIRALALLVRMPVLCFSTNSITGAGSRFSGKKNEERSGGRPTKKKPEPTLKKKEGEIQLLDKLIMELDKKIAELTDLMNMARKLLDRLKKEGG